MERYIRKKKNETTSNPECRTGVTLTMFENDTLLCKAFVSLENIFRVESVNKQELSDTTNFVWLINWWSFSSF